MLWSSPPRQKKESKEQNKAGSSLSVGQTLDLFEYAMEPINMLLYGGNPFNLLTLGMAATDVSLSAANAKPGRTISAGASAVAAQVAGLTSYKIGSMLGARALGTLIGTSFGGPLGSYLGGAAGALIGDQIARSGTSKLIRNLINTRPRVNFGSFKDSQPAYTMRQRAEQELSGSLLNARRYLGREAQLMHQ